MILNQSWRRVSLSLLLSSPTVPVSDRVETTPPERLGVFLLVRFRGCARLRVTVTILLNKIANAYTYRCSSLLLCKKEVESHFTFLQLQCGRCGRTFYILTQRESLNTCTLVESSVIACRANSPCAADLLEPKHLKSERQHRRSRDYPTCHVID